MTQDSPKRLLRRPEPAQVRTGLLKKAPPIPKVIGKPDPRNPGMTLIDVRKAPDHQVFPKMNSSMTFPKTYYRFDKKAQRVVCLVTIAPDGTHLAWDVCRTCVGYFRNCRCKHGVTTCHSVEYIVDSITAKLAGEEWGPNHANYKGSLTRKAREATAGSERTFVPLSTFIGDRPRSSSTRHVNWEEVARRRAEEAAAASRPKKLLKKPILSKSGSKQVLDAVAKNDLSSTAGGADEMVKQMSKMLTKRLTKPSEPQAPVKKLLRRKS